MVSWKTCKGKPPNNMSCIGSKMYNLSVLKLNKIVYLYYYRTLYEMLITNWLTKR